MRVVFLVPRRGGDAVRDRLWAYCRSWWEKQFPDWQVYEGHHDTGMFNRSAAVNRAAGLADWQEPKPWDVAILLDGDVLCDPARVRAAVERAAKTGGFVMPFNIRKDLDERGTRKVINGFTGPWDGFVRRTYPNMVSAVVCIPRRLWDTIGGFDEGFVGWGFEDTAFAAAAATFGPAIYRIPGELWHLYHPTAKEGRVGTPSFEANKRRSRLYLAARDAGDRDRILALRNSSPPSYEANPVGIPRILHRTVPERVDPQAERWWRQFAEVNPGWDLRTHRDPLNPADWPETSGKWADCANGAQLAGLIRLEALLRWGGVYVDSDVEPLRSFEPLLPNSAFAAWEDPRCVPDAVLGAVPGHPAIRECLDLAMSRVPGDTWASGPGVTTSILVGRSDVLVLPPGAFYPYHYKEKQRRGEDFRKTQPWAFVAHHWNGSWLAEK